MITQPNCPCPNLKCPHHGRCDQCTSRHLRKGFLSYCAFHTILPSLQAAIDEDPTSVSAKKLEALIEPQMAAYNNLMATNGLTKERQKGLLQKVAEHSEY